MRGRRRRATARGCRRCRRRPRRAARSPSPARAAAIRSIFASAPRSLNEPVRCRFSAFSSTLPPHSSDRLRDVRTGVWRTRSRVRSRASRTASTPSQPSSAGVRVAMNLIYQCRASLSKFDLDSCAAIGSRRTRDGDPEHKHTGRRPTLRRARVSRPPRPDRHPAAAPRHDAARGRADARARDRADAAARGGQAARAREPRRSAAAARDVRDRGRGRRTSSTSPRSAPSSRATRPSSRRCGWTARRARSPRRCATTSRR